MSGSQEAGKERGGERGITENVDRRDLIEGYLSYYPRLRNRIIRQLLLALHSGGFITIDQLYQKVRERGRELGKDRWEPPDQPGPGSELAHHGAEDEPGDDPGLNRGIAHRWDEEEKRVIDELVIDYGARHFTAGELDALILLTRKRAEAEDLTQIANEPDVTFERLAKKLHEYCELPGDWVRLPAEETIGVRVAILRRFITEQLDFLGIAKHHLTLRDLDPLMRRSVGTKGGSGRLGGKAAGMVLAASILRDAAEREPNVFGPFKTPESIFLRTDLFTEFLKVNGLMQYNDQKYKSLEEIRAEYPAIREVFKNAEFPPGAAQRLREELERIGPHPLIVRSSSLLEDNFNYAFSGKYASIFLGNQGRLDDRVNQVLGAVAEVYASTLGPDPIIYRRARNLIDYDELMGVIIQKVVGKTHGRYLFPAWAGVAFSHNEYRWNKRIRKQDGLMRIVMGLGSRAVDRVGGDYPRMVALGVPTLRPEAKVEDVCRYSQRYLDVIDLKRDQFRSVPLAGVLAEGPYPGLDQIVSIHRDGDLHPPLTRLVDAPPRSLVITFDRMLRSSDFVPRIRWILETLRAEYGREVDVEFAYDGTDFYILQCRPLSCRMEIPTVPVPHEMPAERILFSADREVSSANIGEIEYIVYVDTLAYDHLETLAERQAVSGIVGRLNQVLEGKRFILMGPGRWGSSDLRLGVRVTYADISNTRLLVEVARSRGDYEPEVSFGTHFFQDLVESGIHHLPLYPDRPGIRFNEPFLTGAPNHLAELLPEASAQARIVKVIHVPTASGGLHLRVVMDGMKEEALGFLE